LRETTRTSPVMRSQRVRSWACGNQNPSRVVAGARRVIPGFNPSPQKPHGRPRGDTPEPCMEAGNPSARSTDRAPCHLPPCIPLPRIDESVFSRHVFSFMGWRTPLCPAKSVILVASNPLAERQGFLSTHEFRKGGILSSMAWDTSLNPRHAGPGS